MGKDKLDVLACESTFERAKLIRMGCLGGANVLVHGGWGSDGHGSKGKSVQAVHGEEFILRRPV
jgi:hypothetical protein